MKKTAFLFPGQGSQSVGMGHDFYQEFDAVREIFDMADEICKMNISKLCFNGPMPELTQTINLQPAVTAVNLACLTALRKENAVYHYSAGHSLGEYSALCASRVISLERTLELVFRRGVLMDREAQRQPGTMHAIVGLTIEDVNRLIEEVKSTTGDTDPCIVSVANHNTQNQIVITGSPGPVERVSALAKEKGARALPLRVSGAWHSSLMQTAQDEFKNVIDTTPFSDPQTTTLLNVTADSSVSGTEIQTIMCNQLCSPVRWYDIIQKLIQENVEMFVEVGPGKVLSGLSRKIIPKDLPCQILNVSDLKSFEAFLSL